MQRIYDAVQCFSNQLLPNEYRIQNSDGSVESTEKNLKKQCFMSMTYRFRLACRTRCEENM